MAEKETTLSYIGGGGNFYRRINDYDVSINAKDLFFGSLALFC